MSHCKANSALSAQAFSTGSLVQPDKRSGQKAHALGGVAFGNTQHRAQVDRKAANALLQHGAKEVGFECQGTSELRVQAIERVIALVVVLFQPAG